MNVNILILLIVILSTITLGCVNSSESVNSADNVQTTIRLLKTESTNDVNFKVFHDDEYNVTCWYMDAQQSFGECGNCIPDSDLNKGD